MTVRVERDGPVTIVSIDRPAVRNAVDWRTAGSLADAFEEFDKDDTQSAAVLYGEGGVFSSGADLKAMDQRLEPDGNGPMGPTRMQLSKPVIAAIEGFCVAGGLEMALWCDLRVASRDASFGFFNRRWGVPLIDGATSRLPRLVGYGRAMDLILTGREVSAAEAERMGLVNWLVEPGEVLEEALSVAFVLADLPQQAMRSDRMALIAGDGLDVEEAMAEEFRLGLEALKAGSADRGVSRFVGGAGRGGAPDREPDA
ncbi:crotonase/enoyl-CoA hydratase family protein [Nocardioides coralli]|uniref:crotonase/enoyl-CoA hydratase family protein n=1 Tax=Nocardioides coralli TaxID=2872154 RepID=UPI001CA41995|nr:crotonase/enoyl-CoA hydratase family protein [Nocardioides coralli]QZY29319.1 crotonase/enoyl-CoA hydratase family protein [Nocardioides coralli]